MKLIKLLYLADRAALLRWGHPITTDQYVSMDHGPVLSRTYDLILEGSEPGSEHIWSQYVSEPDHYEVSLNCTDPPSGELSRAEKELIDHTYFLHGQLNRWDLVHYVHKLPEWKDPGGSAIPITYSDILRAGGKTPDEIAEIGADLTDFALAQAMFSR